jgi:MerR family transcriptional regulator/heat shock protein HspR
MQTDDREGRPPGDEPLYVISVAAKLAGLPSWTLRVLDREGIVRPQRTAKDRRLYSDRDIALLARVRYLTEQRGVNMNGVRLILEMEAAPRPGADEAE